MKEKKLIRSIFFDFDGTLGETEPEIRQAWLNAIKSLNLSCPGFDAIFRVGPSLPDTAKMLFPQKSEEERRVIQAAYRHFYDDSEMVLTLPYPWCAGFLKEFLKAGKKLYIVTNKRWIPTMKLLKKFGFSDFFSGIFTPDIVAPGGELTKNQLLILGVRSSGTAPEESLIIGDTILDLRAGAAAGTRRCGVTWGYGSAESLAAENPDLLVRDHELFAHFSEFFR